MFRIICSLWSFLSWLGSLLPLFFIRVMLAWQFWDAGLAKYHSELKSVSVQDVMPFALLSHEISWVVILWLELVGAILLLIGFASRLVAGTLFILVCATLYVDFPANITPFVEFWRSAEALNLKLELAYLLMLFGIFLLGPGRLSVDAFIKLFSCNIPAQKRKKTHEPKPVLDNTKTK